MGRKGQGGRTGGVDRPHNKDIVDGESELFIENLATVYYINKLGGSMGSKILQLAVFFTIVMAVSARSCKDNQYTATNGSCVNCPSNCTACGNAQYCLSCAKNYFLVSQPSGVSCLSCSQIYYACTSCLTNVACLACRDGYFLTNNECRACSTTTPGCSRCTPDGSTCIQCLFPFVLFNGMCYSASTDTSNKPSIGIGAGGPTGPTILDDNGCTLDQIFNNGVCIKKISGCVLYQPTGTCQYCNASYIVSIYGDCTIPATTLKCEEGFWLNTITGNCTAVSATCDWYYPNNGSCYNCSENYKFDDSKNCVPIINCKERSFFYQGTCVDIPASCAEYLNDGSCTKCVPNYDLVGGSCVLSKTYVPKSDCTQPCRTCAFNDLSFCYSCIMKHHLEDAKFGACVPYET